MDFFMGVSPFTRRDAIYIFKSPGEMQLIGIADRAADLGDGIARHAQQLTGLDHSVFMSRDTMHGILNDAKDKGYQFLNPEDDGAWVSTVLLRVSDDADITAVEKEIYNRAGGIKFIETDKLISDVAVKLGSVENIINVTLTVLLVFSFLTMILFFSVIFHERKKEFAVLRILGTSSRRICFFSLTEGITIGASLLEPFMPETTGKILAQLNTTVRDYEVLDQFGLYPSGNKVTDKPEILFARMKLEDIMVEVEKIEAAQRAALAAKEEPEAEEEAAPVEHKPTCTFDDFTKCEFRVGEILECKNVEKSKKLLCSKVKIGPNETVQIISGLRPKYQAEDMVGKKVMVIVNLEPRKMAGLESQGMILVAEDADGNLALMTPEKKEFPAGSEIG